MAKTKSEVDRSVKHNEILAVAQRLFREHGYEATAMSHIAEEAGVAPNTLYWYFADKDALLVAVLNSLVIEGTREFERRKKRPLAARMLWLLDFLGGTRHLMATVHARAEVSESVRVWHDNYHRTIDITLRAQLREHGLPEPAIEHAARIASFVFEGLLAHPSPAKERRALIEWLISVAPTAPRPRRRAVRVTRIRAR